MIDWALIANLIALEISLIALLHSLRSARTTAKQAKIYAIISGTSSDLQHEMIHIHYHQSASVSCKINANVQRLLHHYAAEQEQLRQSDKFMERATELNNRHKRMIAARDYLIKKEKLK